MAAAAPPPRLRAASWLSRPQTQAVFAALAARGYAVRAVGGAVRNALLGLAVSDVDLATPALPADVIAAVEAGGLQAVPTGLAHGTVTVISGGVPHEVTTLRKDVETHGRHATVAFTDDWAADASRRDFTINALYCDAAGEVFDPLGGYGDLLARRVRFIGSADQRIAEDYLRILRFFRFTAEYGAGPPDDEALAACVRGRGGLGILSRERVRGEVVRLLQAPRAVEVAGVMFDHGLLGVIIGLAPRPLLLQRAASLEGALSRAPDAMLRLGALAIEVPEDADFVSDRLRLSGEEHKRLQRMVPERPALSPHGPEATARASLYRNGPGAYVDRVLTAWVRSGAAPDDPGWRELLALPERWTAPKLPVGGADVMALGVPAGPRVGELLRSLEAWWIAGDFAADAAALRGELRRLAAN